MSESPSSEQPVGQEHVRVEFPAIRPAGHQAVPGVALVTIERREALNALNFGLLRELATALEGLDASEDCHCIVLTGTGTRAFASGADIDELARQTPMALFASDTFAAWGRIRKIRTPTIAAVRGYALGGGCELAMTCDMIVAGEDAQFGQPEIRLGVMPGAGGTQRLTRAIGKAKAMELVLTGRRMSAREAETHGLVTTVVPAEETLEAALDLASRIASQPPLAVAAAKEAIDRSFELPLSAGLELEQRLFFLLFSSEDQEEGMAAFAEKREPSWRGR